MKKPYQELTADELARLLDHRNETDPARRTANLADDLRALVRGDLGADAARTIYADVLDEDEAAGASERATPT